MSSKTRTKILPIILTLLVGAAIGYFATPTKVVTKTEIKEIIKEVEKKTSDTKKDKKNDKIVIIVETVLPDGTRKKETKIVDKGTITIDASETTEKETDKTTETKTEKIVERSHDGLLLYAIGGARLNDWTSGPEFGGGVQKRLLGPFWIGAYGTNKLSAGVTLGISF